MPEAVLAYIGLGSNRADARETHARNSLQILQDAVGAIAQLPSTRVRQVSSLWRSAAAEGAAGTGDFLNAVLAIETGLEAHELLRKLQAIELAAGRERPWHHAPRTLDLDILFYGQARMDGAALQIPHPRVYERAFVVKPLFELSPSLVSNQQLHNIEHQVCEVLSQNWVSVHNSTFTQRGICD